MLATSYEFTKTISVQWDDAEKILSTSLSGVLSLNDVQEWQAWLRKSGGAIPNEHSFKMLIDIRGYEVADQDRAVHQVMREVTPLFLLSHGFKLGFFDLYEVEPPISREEGNASCIAVAHVHHDRDKMDRYNELLSTDRERFFSGLQEAEAWLREAPGDAVQE